jgi:hypothetical protein
LILKFLKSCVKANGQSRVKETLAGLIVTLRLTIPKRSTSVIQEADLKDLRRPFLNLFFMKTLQLRRQIAISLKLLNIL